MTVTEAKTWLLAEAEKRGVDLEVLASSTRELFVDAREGKASDVSLSTRAGLGLRVVYAGRVGYASTEDLSEESLAWALSEAIENASLQTERRARLPAGGALGRHDLLDEGLSAPLESKVAAAVDLEQTVTADERVQSMQYARYQEGQEEVEIASTTGVDGGYRRGVAILIAGLVMREGESVKQGFEIDAKREFHQLDPGRTALTALDKIGRQLGAKPLVTGRRRAVLEPDVVSTLVQLYCYALSGKTLAEGKSRLAGRIGERVASDSITLVDDALLEDGLASRPFDSEGTPSQRLTLIEDGVLRSFLHNTDTASRTGQSTTGHAKRSYSSTLAVGPTNLLLLPGSGIGRDDGVIITDLMGVHAGANPISGDVSVQAMGLEAVGGETSPVDDFAISFNLFELFERVIEVGDLAQWIPGHAGDAFKVPSLAFADVSFAGA
ncbi:MAG TPA: TldD/PmbA family protein [Trueperaceae bacterium]|nr:TldD/PmbA family protein [Trueperaceae bacterium]